MSINDDRPTVRLGYWTPPQQYNQPHLEPSTGIRDVEHNVISGATVVQKLGDEAERYTLRGDCFEDDLRELADLTGETVGLRHPVRTTNVLIRSVDGSHTGQYETVKRDDESYREWVYNYTVDMVEI